MRNSERKSRELGVVMEWIGGKQRVTRGCLCVDIITQSELEL